MEHTLIGEAIRSVWFPFDSLSLSDLLLLVQLILKILSIDRMIIGFMNTDVF